MRIAIDGAGRLVVPKALRDDLGISSPTELEISARDGVIEITVADIRARVETRPGRPVIAADGPVALLTVDEVRAAIDSTRR